MAQDVLHALVETDVFRTTMRASATRMAPFIVGYSAPASAGPSSRRVAQRMWRRAAAGASCGSAEHLACPPPPSPSQPIPPHRLCRTVPTLIRVPGVPRPRLRLVNTEVPSDHGGETGAKSLYRSMLRRALVVPPRARRSDGRRIDGRFGRPGNP